MKLSIKNIFLYDEKAFKKNNIDSNKYKLIKYCVEKERQICGNTLYYENDFLYKKSVELIKTINSCKYTKKVVATSIYSTQHRALITLENALQKQIFINNFIFNNNENLIKFLLYCNISINDINNLNNEIKEKKKNNEVFLDTDSINFNVENLCKIYKCKYPTLIINKVLELYYTNPELFDYLKMDDNIHIFPISKIKNKF